MSVTDRLNNYYTNAKIAFKVLKAEAERTGKKKVSIAAVAKEAGLPDRRYLYGYIETPNSDMRNIFKQLGNEIRKFKQEFAQKNNNKKPETEATIFEEYKQNMITQNASLFYQYKQKKDQFEKVVSQRDQQIRLATELQAKLFNVQAQSKEQPNTIVEGDKIQILSRPPIIISPDLGLIRDGAYRFEDKLLRKQSWYTAKEDLRRLLSSPIPTSLSITIGIQGSGKSFWSESAKCIDRRGIIFDATNLTMSSRFEIIQIAKSCPNNDLKICAVCFPISIKTALKRNLKRPADRRVPEDIIKESHSIIEFPTVTGELSSEKFDEISIIWTEENNDK